MMKLTAPFAALAVAASAQAQIQPVSRTSNLSSYETQYFPDGSHTDRWSAAFTDWASGVHSIPSCREDLELSPSQISVAAGVDGTGYYSPMARTGFSRGSGYEGVFIFDLSTSGTITLSGALSARQGNASVSFFDDTRGVQLFTAASSSFSENPFSNRHDVRAGRYRLVLVAHGLPIQPYGPGDATPHVLLTVVPAPCPADFNGDGFLDFFDYDDYVACFETGACPPGKSADFNGDHFADFFDYADFVAAFEAGC